jgi:integrase
MPVPRNVTEAVTAPKRTKKEILPLTSDQACALLNAARGDRLEALYVLAVTAGLRRGELLGLRWQDVDLERGYLQVRQQLVRTKRGLSFTSPKGGKSRSVKLTRYAIEALRSHRKRQLEAKLRLSGLWQDADLVFTTGTGTPLDPSRLTERSFRKLLERAGLPHRRLHDLRHTFATILLSRGTHPKVVQEMLGHANISQTLDTYSHVLPDMQSEAVAAMDDVLRGEHKDLEDEGNRTLGAGG